MAMSFGRVLSFVACPVVAGAVLARLPGILPAEGARLRLDCETVTRCAEGGACEAAGDGVTFTVAPQATDADGAGRYTVIVDGGQAQAAEGLARLGPFSWSSEAGTRDSLTVTGEASALWLRQVIDDGSGAPPRARIDILQCEVTL